MERDSLVESCCTGGANRVQRQVEFCLYKHCTAATAPRPTKNVTMIRSTSSGRTIVSTVCFACVIIGSTLVPALAEDTAEDSKAVPALQLFEDRIMPIFKSPNPSSCVQCHLSSVDIKDYILPSHTDTFAALRSQGLIDVKQPRKSKILTLIDMGEKDADSLARRIHQKTRKAEYEAFSAWIEACCADETLVAASAPGNLDSVGPKQPLEIVRHARKSRVVESFTRNIWSQRMRCFPCHTPNEIDKENPKHQKPAEKQREFVKKYGAKMNLFRETPEASLAALVASSRKQNGKKYPLINLHEPTKSLLLLKPLAKIPPKKDDGTFEKPSASDPVSHVGGLKIHVNDHSYKLFVSWLEDYAAIVGDQYKTVEDLPADNWTPSNRILRVRDVPSDWEVGTVVQLFVHAQQGSRGEWSDQPVAFTQGTVTPRGIVNGAIMLIESNLQPTGSYLADSFPLPAGAYLIKAFVDSDNKVADTPTVLLGAADFAGQATINTNWKIGFPKATTIAGDSLQK